ncbi:hypothetical protein E2C01_084703 [Portunus trituberculatus]|uniref:Uncharacterized protein n=1 Tax=Portunus trituberculatus TaxID=210409 RepID=A0A5B7JBL8_PORTR|nr:hypothetical protein [Portunus trituberculatus]
MPCFQFGISEKRLSIHINISPLKHIHRFIHCTCEDENYYLRTGDLPPHILDQAIRKGHLGDVMLNGDVPICKVGAGT